MKVAVFGAGYAGLTLARRLERRLPPQADLVVVDESASHLVQHELHRVIRRPGLADQITVPLEDCFDRAAVREARVVDVDPDAGHATLADGETLSYDVGAVCLGAETAFYDLPGVEDHGIPLKRVADARRIRAAALDAFEAGDGRVVVGGAGLSGVQVAGELAALAGEEGASGATITLLEQRESVAPNFPANFRRDVGDALLERGVDVRTDATVSEAGVEAVVLDDGTELDYEALVWTGGIRGPDALAGERPLTRSRLRLSGDTFVVGDAAQVVDADGEAVPASAQAAVREGRLAATNVERLVEHRLGDGDPGGFEPRLEHFRFDSPGWLVSVGDGAVAQVGGAVVTGAAANALKTTVGAGYLTSVGAVREAVGLVRDELDLPNGGAAEPDGAEDAATDGREEVGADGREEVGADGRKKADADGRD